MMNTEAQRLGVISLVVDGGNESLGPNSSEVRSLNEAPGGWRKDERAAIVAARPSCH